MKSRSQCRGPATAEVRSYVQQARCELSPGLVAEQLLTAHAARFRRYSLIIKPPELFQIVTSASRPDHFSANLAPYLIVGRQKRRQLAIMTNDFRSVRPAAGRQHCLTAKPHG
jgi:hypothetical protein